jgi:hypothetical protein
MVISKSSDYTIGLMLHNTLALSIEGIPLGWINQSYIDRKQLQEGTRKRKRHRRQLNSNISDKVSLRWVSEVESSQNLGEGNSEVIHIADRKCKYAVESGQVYPGLRHQCRQFGDKIQ